MSDTSLGDIARFIATFLLASILFFYSFMQGAFMTRDMGGNSQTALFMLPFAFLAGLTLWFLPQLGDKLRMKPAKPAARWGVVWMLLCPLAFSTLAGWWDDYKISSLSTDWDFVWKYTEQGVYAALIWTGLALTLSFTILKKYFR